MNKNYFLLLVTVIIFQFSCKPKEKEEKEAFFPVLSFIQSQVANVDTSLYSIIKLNFVDSARTDTEFVRRENFRDLAKDFIEIPDLALSKYKKRFKQLKGYDETLGRVMLSYLPENPEKENIQRQEVLISPGPAGDRVNSIYIDYISTTKDSSLEKKMLWRVDRSFQVTTIKQKPGQPETITTTKVIWNEPEDQ